MTPQKSQSKHSIDIVSDGSIGDAIAITWLLAQKRTVKVGGIFPCAGADTHRQAERNLATLLKALNRGDVPLYDTSDFKQPVLPGQAERSAWMSSAGDVPATSSWWPILDIDKAPSNNRTLLCLGPATVPVAIAPQLEPLEIVWLGGAYAVSGPANPGKAADLPVEANCAVDTDAVLDLLNLEAARVKVVPVNCTKLLVVTDTAQLAFPGRESTFMQRLALIQMGRVSDGRAPAHSLAAAAAAVRPDLFDTAEYRLTLGAAAEAKDRFKFEDRGSPNASFVRRPLRSGDGTLEQLISPLRQPAIERSGKTHTPFTTSQ